MASKDRQKTIHVSIALSITLFYSGMLKKKMVSITHFIVGKIFLS